MILGVSWINLDHVAGRKLIPTIVIHIQYSILVQMGVDTVSCCYIVLCFNVNFA
jgi:hypothetical protein